MTKLIYLASPYTHSNPKIMQTRFVKICKIAAKLMSEGHHVLCPIASSAPIAKYGHLSNTTWEYWKQLDTNYLRRCDELWIVLLDKEWYKSIGMRAEFQIAKDLDIPIIFFDPKKDGKILERLMWDYVKFENQLINGED